MTYHFLVVHPHSKNRHNLWLAAVNFQRPG
jgi:hypothetical protein